MADTIRHSCSRCMSADCTMTHDGAEPGSCPACSRWADTLRATSDGLKSAHYPAEPVEPEPAPEPSAWAHPIVVRAFEHGEAGTWYFSTIAGAESFITNTLGTMVRLYQRVTIEDRDTGRVIRTVWPEPVCPVCQPCRSCGIATTAAEREDARDAGMAGAYCGPCIDAAVLGE